MRRINRAGAGRLLLLASAAAAAPGPADAQMVVGRVLERGGGGPVVGAMVRLSGEGGAAGGGWLTAADGRFRLQAPSAGSYRISVERIGFSSTTVEGVELVENGILSIDVVVEPRAIVLEGLEVRAGGRRCSLDASAGDAAQTLWDEARKALSAATWTEAEVPMRFVASVWDRQIDPRTSQVLYEEREERETVGANSVQSLPPGELVEQGYVRIDPAYSYYYAPDARVLLSDEFLRTHCFRVVESEEDGSPFLGLGFEPDEGRSLPDIEGVIWLDARSGRLDRVEFRYTGLTMAGADRARGEVRWAELANGRWIVREWYIRAPMGRDRVGIPGAMRRRTLSAIHEVGNRVELVEGDDFAWRPDIAPGVVRGTVFDSISAAPLAGAEVRVAGRGLRATTDLWGRFELGSVPPGLHRVTFGHPDLDTLGVVPGWETVALEPGGVREVELTVPSWLTLLARSCGERGAGAVVGVVRTRDGRPAPGASVEAVGRTGRGGAPMTDVTDRFGSFVLCGVEEGVARLAARRGSAGSAPAEARLSASGFVQADLVLQPAAAPPPRVPGALRPALIGVVLAQGGGAPLADVSVELLDGAGEVLASTLSDEDGAFRIVLDEGAEAYLRVSRLGFTGAVSEALDVTDGTRRIEVRLPEEAIPIEPVVVVVEGRHPRLEVEGFYGRATSSPGMFIRRDDVEAVAPARTTDLLGRAPGVSVRTDPLSGDLRRRVTFQRLALTGGERCYPAVYVDGELVRVGGSRSESEAPTIEGIEPLIEDRSDIPSLDELVPPHEILAVEMYQTPGQVPRRFVGLGTHCGVIVVWTTRGDAAGRPGAG